MNVNTQTMKRRRRGGNVREKRGKRRTGDTKETKKQQRGGNKQATYVPLQGAHLVQASKMRLLGSPSVRLNSVRHNIKSKAEKLRQ